MKRHIRKVALCISMVSLAPAIILFLFSKRKSLILSDVKAWAKYRDFVDVNQLYKSLLLLLLFQPEFQSQFKMRLGGIGRLSLLGGGKRV